MDLEDNVVLLNILFYSLVVSIKDFIYNVKPIKKFRKHSIYISSKISFWENAYEK